MPTHPTHDAEESLRAAAMAALAALILLDIAMFVAMLAGVAPHPPGARGPYIAATAALAVAALVRLIAVRGGPVTLLVLTALVFIPVVGPHKFFTESAAPDLAPLIVVGTGALLTLLVVALRLHRLQRAGDTASTVAAGTASGLP